MFKKKELFEARTMAPLTDAWIKMAIATGVLVPPSDHMPRGDRWKVYGGAMCGAAFCFMLLAMITAPIWSGGGR